MMILIFAMFGTATPALLAFPEERPVFLRESSTNHYSVMSYFVSRLTMEAFVTALQSLVQVTVTYFLVCFQANFLMYYLNVYVLAMTSTALAVMFGCAVEDPKIAQEMLPILFVPQMLFAGFFVVPDLIPVWLRWARYACPLTYSVRIGLVDELNDDGCGDDVNDNDGEANDNCENLLATIDADPDETWWNWLILLGLFIFFRLLALYILRQKANKFF